MPSARRLAAVVAAAAALATVDAGGMSPAAAQDPQITEREEILSSLSHERFAVPLADGSVARGNILRYRSDDPHLELRPVLAHDRVVGTETTPSMAGRKRDEGALAGTNGGYWMTNLPPASPNGYAIHDGWLVAGQSRTGSGLPRARGVLGILAGGDVLFDRLNVSVDLRRPDASRVPVDQLNRHPQVGGEHPSPGELIAYEPIFGAPAPAPAGSRVVVVEGLQVPRSASASGTVTDVTAAGDAGSAVLVPAGGAVLIAHGDARPRLDGIAPGDTVSVRVRPAPLASDPARWGDVASSLPGGPHLLRDGVITPEDGWSDEAFRHDHLHGRHARTAVAATADGEVLLLTVDRRAGHSPGMTLRELVSLLRRLGARDAVNLDGGGSTTMTVDGEVRNRLSEGVPRSMANGLFVHHSPVTVTARDPRLHACDPTLVPDSDFTDIAGNTHEESITCLVWYGVTGGTTPTSYTPVRAVTRAQMATFVTNMIDYAAADGGRALPPYDGENRFRDVAGTHLPAVNRLAAAGIARGGPGALPPDRYGPDRPVSRAQMATFIAGALRYITDEELPGDGDAFADDHGSAHEENINRLAAAGIVHGREPGFYAPHASVQRSAMASFLVRSLDLLVERGVAELPPD